MAPLEYTVLSQSRPRFQLEKIYRKCLRIVLKNQMGRGAKWHLSKMNGICEQSYELRGVRG